MALWASHEEGKRSDDHPSKGQTYGVLNVVNGPRRARGTVVAPRGREAADNRRMNADSAHVLPRLARLAVKDAVGLGGLSPGDLTLALATCWQALPPGLVCTEPEINRHLKAALTGAAAWLDTDHVELRRWLVDLGWLQRDGYGREYRRVEAGALRTGQRELADTLATVEVGAWVSGQRAAHQEARNARRRNWPAAQGPAA